MVDLNAFIAAANKAFPETCFFEIGERELFEVLKDADPSYWDYRTGPEDRRFMCVPVKVRKYLVGWRLLSIQPRGKPDLHVAAISPDFNEKEADKYERWLSTRQRR